MNIFITYCKVESFRHGGYRLRIINPLSALSDRILQSFKINILTDKNTLNLAANTCSSILSKCCLNFSAVMAAQSNVNECTTALCKYWYCD